MILQWHANVLMHYLLLSLASMHIVGLAFPSACREYAVPSQKNPAMLPHAEVILLSSCRAIVVPLSTARVQSRFLTLWLLLWVYTADVAAHAQDAQPCHKSGSTAEAVAFK